MPHGTWQCHLGDEGQDAVCSLSGCCSLREYVHPPTAFPQRSSAAGLEGYLPCLVFWLSH